MHLITRALRHNKNTLKPTKYCINAANKAAATSLVCLVPVVVNHDRVADAAGSHYKRQTTTNATITNATTTNLTPQTPTYPEQLQALASTAHPAANCAARGLTCLACNTRWSSRRGGERTWSRQAPSCCCSRSCWRCCQHLDGCGLWVVGCGL